MDAKPPITMTLTIPLIPLVKVIITGNVLLVSSQDRLLENEFQAQRRQFSRLVQLSF
jgi:hypothetical protein